MQIHFHTYIIVTEPSLRYYFGNSGYELMDDCVHYICDKHGVINIAL